MRWLRPFALVFLPLLTLFLPSCGSNSTPGTTSGRHPAGIGPFDRNGNYVEAWADTPSKWGKKSALRSVASTPSAEVDEPAVASSDEPPADAVPLPPSGSTLATVKATTPPLRKSGEVVVASLSKPKTSATNSTAKTKSQITADSRIATKKPVTKNVVATKTKPKLTPKEIAVAKAKAKAKTTAIVSAKAKSKAVAATATKKKPSARYTVKKGDNLVKIADRFDTTAAAIRKANGLKTGVVAPGKTLVIPKG